MGSVIQRKRMRMNHQILFDFSREILYFCANYPIN